MSAVQEWLLLRGLGRQPRHWGEFPARLSAQLGGAAVDCATFPGSGDAHRQRSPARIEHYVDALRAERPAGRRVLVGLSMGGMVALNWARRFPAEVAAVVLINSSSAAYSPWWQRLRPLAAGVLLLAWGAPPRWREALLYRLTTASGRERAATLDAWCQIQRQQPISRLNLWRQLQAARRERGAVPALPALVLASRIDPLADYRCSRALANALACPLSVHPWGSHDLPFDDPEWVAAEIARWWRDEAVGGALTPTD